MAGAELQIERFLGRFGSSYRLMAYYAALPLVLTPELLNYLRSKFLHEQVPWVAEADLLLSDLCRPVGYEQYVMNTAVRAHLLKQVREQLGLPRMREAAQLLIHYIHYISRLYRWDGESASFSGEQDARGLRRVLSLPTRDDARPEGVFLLGERVCLVSDGPEGGAPACADASALR